MTTHIPNTIRVHRKRKGLRQQDIANYLGHRFTDRISLWEQGKAMPSVMNLFKLSSLLEVLPHELYEKVEY